jgi:hypothetical protein
MVGREVGFSWRGVPARVLDIDLDDEVEILRRARLAVMALMCSHF